MLSGNGKETKKTIAALSAVAMMLSLVACDGKVIPGSTENSLSVVVEPDKEGTSKVSETTETTESSEETTTEAAPTEQTESETSETETEPSETEVQDDQNGVLTSELLDGIWLEGDSEYLKVDIKNQRLVFLAGGTAFTLEEVCDDHIKVSGDFTEEMLRRSRYTDNKVEKAFVSSDIADGAKQINLKLLSELISSEASFNIPVRTINSDEIEILGTKLRRSTAKDDARIISTIEGVVFEEGYHTNTIEFTDDGICKLTLNGGETQEFSYSVKDGKITVNDGDYSLDLYIIASENGYVQLTSSRGGWWLSKSEGKQSDNAKISGDYIRITDDDILGYAKLSEDGRFDVLDMDGKVLDSFEFQYVQDGYYMVEGNESEALLPIDHECIMRLGDMSMLLRCDNPGARFVALADEIRKGDEKNQIYESEEYEADMRSGTVRMTVDIRGNDIEDIWLPDYCLVYDVIDKDDMYMEFCEETDDPVSDGLWLSFGDEFGSADLEFRLKAGDYDPEDLVLKRNNGIGKCEVCEDAKITEDGDEIVVSYEITSKDFQFYFVSDKTLEELYSKTFDAQTVLETDPEDSVWVRTHDCGDIPGLVDMKYLKESVYDLETGSAVFWVSTPEQLATAVYYVNALDVTHETEYRTMFYIHILEDLDLSGYRWTSMGHRDGDETSKADHFFQGIIFGNGHTIKGLNIPEACGRSFLDSAHMTTVIGLTFEEPAGSKIGKRNVIEDNISCITEMIDCHVILGEDQSPDKFEFSSHDNESIVFFDCSFTAAGEKLDMSDYSGKHYNGSDNWVMRYYKDKAGKYTYDGQAEYEAYQKDPDKFRDCSYYFGVDDPEEQTKTGKVAFTGWKVNDEFYLNFGLVD